MSTWDRASNNYSGQGVVLISRRDANGKPKGLLAQGDITALKLSASQPENKIKESQSGQRGTTDVIYGDLEMTLEMTVQNHSHDVIADALRGDVTRHGAGSVADEAIAWYPGGVQPLSRLKVSNLVVSRGATALDAYTNDSTAWDYKVNAEAGSIKYNDGSAQTVSKITTGGTAPSAIAVGTTTRVTVANASAVGDSAVFTGFTGADAALINGKAIEIVAATATYVDLALDTTGKTITLGTPLSCFSGQGLTADFDHEAQYEVNAFTESALDRYLRFEGLNTLDEFRPVVLDVFKFRLSPTEGYDLITDENAATFVIKGTVLSDALQSTGSKYFRERLLR